jgi:hypothetical protein
MLRPMNGQGFAQSKQQNADKRATRMGNARSEWRPCGFAPAADAQKHFCIEQNF